MSERKARDGAYDFGWGFARRRSFSIGFIACVALAVGIFLIDSRLYLLTAALLYISIQLLLGDIAVWSIDPGEELVLPYVSFLRSDSDLILDAGCGSGRASIAVGKIMKSGRIIAVDRFGTAGEKRLLERNLAIAKLDGRVDVREEDIAALAFAEGTFDAVVSADGLDRMDDDGKLKGLKEINRVLKKGGRVLLLGVVPNYCLHGIHLRVFNALSGHKRASAKRWKRLFDDAGFTCISEGNINCEHYFLLEKTA